MPHTRTYLAPLAALLQPQGVQVALQGNTLVFNHTTRSWAVALAGEDYNVEQAGAQPFLALDYLQSAPEKIAALALTRLQLNRRVFARQCRIERINKTTANHFVNRYHFMPAAQSATQLGLYRHDELLAVACFSAGRRMHRLPAHQRSFELIRYCCKSGVSISGGLSKLLQHFVAERAPGDLMTYVDLQWGQGQSFRKIGFVEAGRSAAHYFLVHRATGQRAPLKDPEQPFDRARFYRAQNAGNLKLIYTPLPR